LVGSEFIWVLIQLLNADITGFYSINMCKIRAQPYRKLLPKHM